MKGRDGGGEGGFQEKPPSKSPALLGLKKSLKKEKTIEPHTHSLYS